MVRCEGEDRWASGWIDDWIDLRVVGTRLVGWLFVWFFFSVDICLTNSTMEKNGAMDAVLFKLLLWKKKDIKTANSVRWCVSRDSFRQSRKFTKRRPFEIVFQKRGQQI